VPVAVQKSRRGPLVPVAVQKFREGGYLGSGASAPKTSGSTVNFAVLYTVYFAWRTLSEYPTEEEYLNQHGNLFIYEIGFTSLERKYLRFLLILMSGVDVVTIADVDIKVI
jgi:hypothetical protein